MKHFLWPEPQALSPRDLFGPRVSNGDVESRLKSLYPAMDAVVFSSARAGLTAVLQASQISRPDQVWCPPFSSHCVLEAVAHVGTPTPVAAGAPAAALLYHQWGHAHRTAWPAPVRLIEDAVDSLLMPGHHPAFNGGDFVLWSLPKVLRTQGGGVVFCRHANDATALRSIRQARPCSWLQSMLRWQSKHSAGAARYWNGAEAMQGELPAPWLRQLLRSLASIEALVDDRRALLAGLSGALRDAADAAGRLPSNLPMSVPGQWQRVWCPDGPLTAGLRSFNLDRLAPSGRWGKVAPLPVHADVSAESVRHILRLLDLRCFCHEFDFV